ncbi:MAG TPA: metallophosphoesterase [Candidatus Limnocylindrales bacterium]|nr:metallophosphoesterase [Candidatus Limnocylindrales bacterium]
MIRRVEVAWPDARPFAARGGRPIRMLAASDELDPALDHPRNRAELGELDLVVGCGDLEPDYLAFLGDAFGVPLLHVRGNHDRGIAWGTAERIVPEALPDGRIVEEASLSVAGLSWPGPADGRAVRDDLGAWRQVLPLALRAVRRPPLLVLSHVPPRGLGDDLHDPFHAGFGAYRWLLERARPPLWLHGHTHCRPSRDRVERHGRTTLVNVTGAVLVELRPPGRVLRP